MLQNMGPGGGHDPEDRSTLVFQHERGQAVFFALLSVMCTLGLVMLSRDPAYRAEFCSPKALGITGIILFALIGCMPLMRRLWPSAWRFEITGDGLVATHQFWRTRHDIPWAMIREVSKVPPAPFAGSARRQFSRIVLVDGAELLFASHLSRYSDFVVAGGAEVRLRAGPGRESRGRLRDNV